MLAFVAVAGAVMLIFAREPIHSALALILVMVSLAVLYLLLGAEFIAAVQMIVYAGAVMVLFVFVIMLLNAGMEDRTQYQQDRDIDRTAAWLFSCYLGLRTGWRILHRHGVANGVGRRSSRRLDTRTFHGAVPAISVPV